MIILNKILGVTSTSPTEASVWRIYNAAKSCWIQIEKSRMKHFLIFNYDFPKYVRLDVGNETRMHLDKQGRYLLQPNRINGRVYYEQITGSFMRFIL